MSPTKASTWRPRRQKHRQAPRDDGQVASSSPPIIGHAVNQRGPLARIAGDAALGFVAELCGHLFAELFEGVLCHRCPHPPLLSKRS
jgi:hypothetical protein